MTILYTHSTECLTPKVLSGTDSFVTNLCGQPSSGMYQALNQDGGDTYWTSDPLYAATIFFRVDCGLTNGDGWKVVTYTITAGKTVAGTAPPGWKLYGSYMQSYIGNNIDYGSASTPTSTMWILIDSQVGQSSWVDNEMRTYAVANPGIYLGYRFEFPDPGYPLDNTGVCIGEVELIGTVEHLYTAYTHNTSGLTPAMTSLSTPSPVSLDAYTTPVNVLNDSKYKPVYNAFAQDGLSSVLSYSNNSVQYVDFHVYIYSGRVDGYGWRVTEYTVSAGFTLLADNAPKSWNLYGVESFTGNLILLHSVTGETNWLRNEMRSYAVPTPGIYLAYKLVITEGNGGTTTTDISEIELIGSLGYIYPVYAHNNACVTPAMISNSSPYPYTVISGSFEAFNQDGNTASWDSQGLAPRSLIINSNSYSIASVVNSYTITIIAGGYAYPTSWSLYGGTNIPPDTPWVLLDTRTNEVNWYVNEMRAYTFSNTQAFVQYKLAITASVGYVGIGEFELIGIPTDIHKSTLFHFHG